MTQRQPPANEIPELMRAMTMFSDDMESGVLDKVLTELVKIRISQLNRCPYCILMHRSNARRRGETDDRLNLLKNWRVSSLYTNRERAALLWAETLTTNREIVSPDPAIEEAAGFFSREELEELTLIIAFANAWNRVSLGLRTMLLVKTDHN